MGGHGGKANPPGDGTSKGNGNTGQSSPSISIFFLGILFIAFFLVSYSFLNLIKKFIEVEALVTYLGIFISPAIANIITIIIANIIAIIIAIIAITIAIIIYSILSKNTTNDHPLELASLLLLGAIGLALIINGINLAIEDNFGVSFASIGIGCFLFSLALMSYLTYCSIQDDEKRRRRSLLILDRKEIRRSLALSFTILFILLIAFYFLEAERVVNSAFNSLQTLDENRTKLAVERLTSLSNVITAFTTIYVVIIGFYFGSRVYEKIKEIKNAEETLKIRYIMDDIEVNEFHAKMKVLRGLKTTPLLEIKAIKGGHKITIEHKGGDAIDLKNAKVTIEMNKKKTWIDPVAHAGKKDVFKEGEKMEIDMGDEIQDDDYPIKVANKETTKDTGIKMKSFCNCITDGDWTPGGNVEITVIFTDTTGEIISVNEKSTINGSAG
jgi:hypothetical protein